MKTFRAAQKQFQIRHDPQIKRKEEEIAALKEKEEYEADAPRREFMAECKGSRHESGEMKGVRKSGGTCRKEWKELSSS